MSQVIVTDRNNSLISFVAKIFPASYSLWCLHLITKNVRSKIKEILENKQIKDGDEKWSNLHKYWNP